MGWARNHLALLHDGRFWNAIRLTCIYTVSSVFLQVAIGLALAMAFFRSFRGQGILRVSAPLPMILAPVVVGLAFRTMIMTPEYGILDYLFILLGLGSQPWLVDPTWALISVIIIHTWQWTPFAFLVFLASLNALPAEPLEAALLDAKNNWQRFWHVILPYDLASRHHRHHPANHGGPARVCGDLFGNWRRTRHFYRNSQLVYLS